MCSKPYYILGDSAAGYIPVIPQFHCLRLALLYDVQVFGVHHKSIIFAGYFLCAASTGWTLTVCWLVRYLVRWDTGCSVVVASSNSFLPDWDCRRWEIGWWVSEMFSVEMGCTLGGGGVHPWSRRRSWFFCCCPCISMPLCWQNVKR